MADSKNTTIRAIYTTLRDSTDQPLLTTIPQRIESVFWTLKDPLNLEHRGAPTQHNLCARIGCRLLLPSQVPCCGVDLIVRSDGAAQAGVSSVTSCSLILMMSLSGSRTESALGVYSAAIDSWER